MVFLICIWKIDLHVHTVYSDGKGSVKEVLEVARQKGLNGLAITDHNTIDGYFAAKSYGTDIYILLGYEVTTYAGHILVLGLERTPPAINLAPYPYEHLMRWVKRMGGLVLVATLDKKETVDDNNALLMKMEKRKSYKTL